MNVRTMLMTWPGRAAILVIVAGLVGGGAMVARSNSEKPQQQLRTTTVTRGSVTQTVSVSGSVSAQGQARLAFKTGGKLAQIYVTVGQTVTAGQPLAKLDTTDLDTALANAQQSLANAQASYQKAVLSANDTRAALAETQKSTATDVANAQSALAKSRSNYSAAKTNLGSFTNGTLSDLGAYRTAIDTLRTQVQQALTDISLYGTADVNSARNSLNSADGSLASAQTYASGLLASAMSDFTGARDALTTAVAQFDAAVDAGGDTSGAASAYQTVLLTYNVNLARLQSAIDTVTAQVSSAQTSVNSALTSLNSQASRTITAFDTARTDIATAQSGFTNQGVVASTAKTRLTQSGTPLNTISDAVNGSLVNAINAVPAAQDRAATSVRNAQSAVNNIPYNLQASQVSVDSALNSVKTAQINLDNAVLTAPSAGIVASIANQLGEFVSGGNTNSAFIVLTNTNAMVLHGTVGEADVPKLKLGQVATITVDALGTQKMTGKVTSLDPVATISQGVPVYGIDIAIDVPAQSLKAGMSGTAGVILASKTNVLTVPNTTIRTVSGQRGVQVLKDGEAVDTVVQFGIANDSVTEVVNGLAEGDTVVIPQARATASGGTNRQGGGFGPGSGQVILGR